MTMLRAIDHRHGGDDQPFGTVVLDHTERHLRRKLIVTSQGDKVMVDLADPVLFADGDVLVLEDGRTIEIIAAKEKLYEVRPGAGVPLRHLAWHLGNRHLAAQIDEDRILIQRDHVIRDMLLGLGAAVTEVIERFQTVHGAYHRHGHSHEHDHDHGVAHRHSSPAQSHGRKLQGDDPDHGKRDKYGRLPGDPHYGHNHG
jgi:urease accessory protein